LSSGEQQPSAIWILANHSSERIVGNSIRDSLPSLAVVVRLVEIRLEVVELVHRRGDVGRSRVDRRSINRVDLNPFGHSLWRDVLPALAAVASDMHKTIVRAYPDDSFFNRRFHHRENRAVVFDAGVVFGNG